MKSRVEALTFQWRVIEKFLDEIDMSQQHSSAAVSFQAQGIKRVTKNRRKA